MINNSRLTIDCTLGRDPETKITPSGLKVANVSVAINIGKKEENRNPIWWNIVAWRYQAEILGELRKGDAVHIEGCLDQEEWQDRNTGENRKRLVLIADSICKRLFRNSEPKKQPEQSYPDAGGYETDDSSEIPF